MRIIQLFLKRLFDFIISLVAIIILSPVFLIIAVAIKLTSKGPVFFKQERLGRKGKVFKILKFRTMIVNAEHIGDGLSVKSEKDPRITSVGRILRATSLDELPNLINTCVGSMSIVGPRPPVTYHPYPGYENYPDWAKKRFEMRPGITGLAQATVRNSATWDERIKIDNEYINKFSLWMDIKVLVLTVMRVLKSKDIYATPANNKTENPEQTTNEKETDSVGK